MTSPAREFSVLERICRPGQLEDSRVLIGPGDDLALVRAEGRGDVGGAEILVGVDQLIDGIHVDIATVGWSAAGRKAVTRSLSDIAAMAGRPVSIVVSAAVPPDVTEASAMELFDAMKETASQYHAPLVGGDLAILKEGPLTCAVTVMAVPPPQGAVTRFGAQPGDGLYVTGQLGGAWRGTHHLTFEPRLSEASMLRAILQDRLHAMLDISDGLGRDAAHLVERSGLQVVIEADALPCRDGADVSQAVGDGEDYELLLAAAGEVPEGLGACPVTRIGTIQERPDPDAPPVVLEWNGANHDISQSGWEHQ